MEGAAAIPGELTLWPDRIVDHDRDFRYRDAHPVGEYVGEIRCLLTFWLVIPMMLAARIACLLSVIGAMVSLKAGTVRQAQQKLEISVFIIAYLVPMAGVYGLRYVPQEMKDKVLQSFLSGEVATPALVFSVLLAVLILLLHAITNSRFKRARLILCE